MEKAFTSSELDSMNASTSPVNPIRNIPGAGLVVMGARTLKQDGTANKYVNMRRSLIYIRKELKNRTEFAIFENNDENLWSRIRTTISVFLGEYRNQGGLRGGTDAVAFFVKCDAENNTAAQIANGEVHIQVGVALQYPAEFIVIDLSQKTLN
jgi:phage tail sheath protein FI